MWGCGKTCGSVREKVREERGAPLSAYHANMDIMMRFRSSERMIRGSVGTRLSSALLALLLALVLGSCAGSNYVIPGTQVPMFDRAGEVEASGLVRLGASAGNDGAPIDYLGQIAWSPVDGLALLGAVSWIPRPSSLTDSALDAGFPLFGLASAEALYLEGGIGWYGKTGWEDFSRYELFAGYGQGHALSLVPLYDDDLKWFEKVGGEYHRLFVQADLGRSVLLPCNNPWMGGDAISKNVMGGSMRMAWVWFSDFTGRSGSTARPRGLFLEPVWFMRSGWPFLQLEAQGGVGVRLFGSEEMTWTYCYINLGLHLSIDM